MKVLFRDLFRYISECKSENFGFYCAAGYIIFSYLRPHALFPQLNFFPWTQAFIMLGLGYGVIKGTLRFQSSHFAVFLFGIASVISTIYSFNVDQSLKNLSTIFVWMLEIIFFTACITTLHQLRLILILFFIVLFKISLFGAKTWVMRGFAFQDYGIAGPNGFFENSGELSLLMAMLVIMSASVIHQNKQISRWYYILPITAFMTVLGASSRASQLGLVAGMFIFFIARGQFNIRYLIIGIFVCYLGFQLLPEGQKKRFTSAGTDSTSVSRLTYWGGGIKMFQEHPIVGVGYRCFPDYFHRYYHYMIPEGQSWGGRKEVAHNTLIEVGSEMGTIGLITYLYVYYLVFKLNRISRRKMRNYIADTKASWAYQFSIGLDIAQIVFFVGGFFMSVALYPYNYFMLMFAGALLNSVSKAEAEFLKANPIKSKN
jgi:putative inorganic carbon (hco3(-)) transporter